MIYHTCLHERMQFLFSLYGFVCYNTPQKEQVMNWQKVSLLPDKEFVGALYNELLGREVDDGGLTHYLQLLQEKKLDRRQIVRYLKCSAEYRLQHAKSEVPALVEDNLRLLEEEISQKKTVITAQPRNFNLDMIGICNMRPPCAMCMLWENETGPRYHKGLTVEDVRAFGAPIRLATEVINCSIGEPLILRDLVPIMQLFAEWEKPLGLNSNGLALTPALTDKLAPYFEYLTITFSLDAATEETYARIRGPHFKRVIENIAYYSRRRREMHPEGTASKTGIVMMPMRVNRHEMADFVRLGARLGMDTVELRALNQIDHDWQAEKGGYLFDYRKEMLSREELAQCQQEAEAAARESGIILDVQYQVGEDKTFNAFVTKEHQGGSIKCFQPWYFILPYQSGETIGCCYMNKSLGDWRNEGLPKLINSKRMQALRRQMATGKLPLECRNYMSCPVVQADLGASNLAEVKSDSMPKKMAQRARRLIGGIKRRFS
jgi:MoaA/NifB/PqqE/SkfB family radical SAM enzyme